jgi:hypothetical protein
VGLCLGVDPYVAHIAFLAIKEYRDMIFDMGAGPDKGEPGHDPNCGGYGSYVANWPKIEIHFSRGGAVHVWPSC